MNFSCFPGSPPAKMYYFRFSKLTTMIHPATTVRYIDPTIGYGVFATEFIPMGTITWVRDALDREISPADFDKLPQQVAERALVHAYRNAKGNYILPWDNTRYTNHSFFANTIPTPYNFEVAIKDIQPGEQITNDYGTLNIIEAFEPCDEGHERKWVYPDDLLRYHREYDAAIFQSLLQAKKHVQPLWSLLPASTRELINRIVDGKEKPSSIQSCYCQPEIVGAFS